MTAIFHPASNLKTLAQTPGLKLLHGEGVYVYDADGKQYIEGLAGLWCTALGYGVEELAEVAAEQMRTLAYTHLFAGKSHEPAELLAAKLAAMVPVEEPRIFFGNSGSDANDTAIKLIKYYFNAIGKPAKKKIIARERAYHGITIASACLTGLPANHARYDLPFEALGVLRTDCPHYYRGGQPGETEEQFSTRMAENLEALILAEGPDTVAAFIAEPVQGAGGVVLPPKGYFEKIQAVLKQYDVLMIADEVITGFGRTGNDFGSTTYGIRPDMMTLAKALSSAYAPISALVVPGFMYDAMIEPSHETGSTGHGYTYSGHPVAAAVALRTLEIYEREDTFKKAAHTGDYFRRQLAVLNDHPLVGEIRSVGLIAGVELVADKATGRPFDGGKVGMYAYQRAEEHGLIVRAIGNTIALCPPLIISRDQVDEVMRKLKAALDETLAFARTL